MAVCTDVRSCIQSTAMIIVVAEHKSQISIIGRESGQHVTVDHCCFKLFTFQYQYVMLSSHNKTVIVCILYKGKFVPAHAMKVCRFSCTHHNLGTEWS